MTVTCKLYRYDQWTASAIELELFSGQLGEGQGWRLQNWQPVIPDVTYGRDTPPIQEEMRLICDTTSHDQLAVLVQVLDELRIAADRYIRNPREQHPVWLYAKMDEETGERRSIVRRLSGNWRTNLLSLHSGPPDNRVAVKLTLEREPYWERTTIFQQQTNTTPISGAALLFDYTTDGGAYSHDPVGDLPARIALFLVFSNNSTGANVRRLWMGFRSAALHGTIDNFEPIWELEDGTNNASESGVTDEIDPTASGGYKVQVVETDLEWDGTWQRVSTIELGDVTVNYSDNFGDFSWLLRGKVSASGSWDVQLRWGYTGMDDTSFVRGAIKEINTTSWNVYEMGRKPIPLRNLRAIWTGLLGANYDRSYAVQVWARRTSGGTENLELDCFMPVPYDEAWLKSWKFELASAANEYWRYQEGPTGQKQALAYLVAAYDSLSDVAAFSSSQFRLPVGDGRLVLVYADENSQDISDTIVISDLRYYERWANLRGAE